MKGMFSYLSFFRITPL